VIPEKLTSINRKRMIRLIAASAPWLTHGDIAKWVGGCTRKYVWAVLNSAT